MLTLRPSRWIHALSLLLALSLVLALSCSAKAPSHHPERAPLSQPACSELPTCLEMLERSSDLAAQEHAEVQLAAFGAAAIPRLSWLVEQGDPVAQYRAAGALGRIAATNPDQVLAIALLRERCADSGWSACWALAQTRDHSVYPLLARHLRAGIDISSLFDGRAVPAVVAEWFIVELEDRAASAAIHTGVVEALQRAEGPLSSAALERVRKLLRAELPADLSHAPPGYPCSTSGGECEDLVDRSPDAQQCPASFSECWPRVDYLVDAVGAWGPRGFPAREELRTVWQSTPAPHEHIARKALARIGDRSIVPSLLRELSPLHALALRDLQLLGKAAQPEVPQLLALLPSAPGNERDALLETILAIGGPQALPVGIEALHKPADDDVTALKGLLAASRESAARDALRPEKAVLEDLAVRSYSGQVRVLASELLVALGFEPPTRQEPPACPPVLAPTRLAPRAQLASGPVTFEPLGSPARSSTECALGELPAIRVGAECLRGHSSGEFGYQITVHDAAEHDAAGPDAAGQASPDRSRGRVRGVGLNPVQFLRYGEQLLVIEALAHGFGRGRIDRLNRDSNGLWVAHRFTDLPGLPVGYAFDAGRRLLILVQSTIDGACQTENGGWQVLRAGTDGALEALP